MNDDTLQLPAQPEYDHVQHAPLYWLMLAPAFFLLWVAIVLAHDAQETAVLLAASIAVALLAYSMKHLRVYDGGDSLQVRFGPFPMFGKRVPYDQIAAAERDRTRFIDGWGVHWVPFRGWTYNLWGNDCVRLTLTRGRTLRIGTDDPEGLAQFLQERCLLAPDGAGQ